MAEPKHPTAFLDQLNLIYYALLSVSLALFAYTYLQEESGIRSTIINYENDPALAWSLRVAIGVVALVDTAAGFVLFRRQIGTVRADQPLADKLNRYRSSFLFQIGLYFSAQLLTAVFYYFSGDVFFAFLYVVVLLITAASRPSLHALRTLLPLSEEELRQLSASDVVT